MIEVRTFVSTWFSHCVVVAWFTFMTFSWSISKTSSMIKLGWFVRMCVLHVLVSKKIVGMATHCCLVMTTHIIFANLMFKFYSLFSILIPCFWELLDLLLHLVESLIDVLLRIFMIHRLSWIWIWSCDRRHSSLMSEWTLTAFHLWLLDLMHLKRLDLFFQFFELFILFLLAHEQPLIELFLVLEALDSIFEYSNLSKDLFVDIICFGLLSFYFSHFLWIVSSLRWRLFNLGRWISFRIFQIVNLRF